MESSCSIQSVVIIDENGPFCAGLGRSFKQLGISAWVADQAQQVQIISEKDPPDLIVTELRVAGQWAFDIIDDLRDRHPACPVVICTAYPSVATAVRAVRCGFAGYVAKPATAPTILEVLDEKYRAEAASDDQADSGWPSLARTMWEHINQVYATAGTMSEAARRLRLHPRSLRRMLAKYPPAR